METQQIIAFHRTAFHQKKKNCGEKQHLRASFQVMRMLKFVTVGQKHVGRV